MSDSADAGAVELIRALDELRKQAATEALDMTLNEIATMHRAGELITQPEYQRLFRWSEVKQSQFIESLLLGLPVPPIYVIEKDDGKWELIDGLQRISTYLYFRGWLADEKHEIGKYLELTDCDIVHNLNGYTFETLPAAIQLKLKRIFLRVEVIQKATDIRFRYHMFKRLNTGGESLSEQEVRNCTIRLLGSEFNDFIIRLATKKDSFAKVIDPLSEDSRSKMGDVALVLRFFAFKNSINNFTHDIDPFMSEFMEQVSDPKHQNHIEFDYDKEEKIFDAVFDTLAGSLGEDTCRQWIGSKYSGGFFMHHFEAISLGVGRVAERIKPKDAAQRGRIGDALKAIKKEKAFGDLTRGGGKNSRGLYENKIGYVAERVEAVL